MVEVEHPANYTLSAHVWVAQNLWPTTPGEAIWHAHVRQRRGMAFSLWPRLTTGFESDTCDFLSELISGSNMCPLASEESVSAVANQVTPDASKSAQRWPPSLPDNRFAQDKSQRIYVCDNCENRVS